MLSSLGVLQHRWTRAVLLSVDQGHECACTWLRLCILLLPQASRARAQLVTSEALQAQKRRAYEQLQSSLRCARARAHARMRSAKNTD